MLFPEQDSSSAVEAFPGPAKPTRGQMMGMRGRGCTPTMGSVR